MKETCEKTLLLDFYQRLIKDFMQHFFMLPLTTSSLIPFLINSARCSDSMILKQLVTFVIFKSFASLRIMLLINSKLI